MSYYIWIWAWSSYPLNYLRAIRVWIYSVVFRFQDMCIAAFTGVCDEIGAITCSTNFSRVLLHTLRGSGCELIIVCELALSTWTVRRMMGIISFNLVGYRIAFLNWVPFFPLLCFHETNTRRSNSAIIQSIKTPLSIVSCFVNGRSHPNNFQRWKI